MLILSHLINKRTHSFNPEHHTGHKRKENNKRMEDKILKINRASEWQSLGGTPCLLYTSPSPRDRTRYRMPSSAWKKIQSSSCRQVVYSKIIIFVTLSTLWCPFVSPFWYTCINPTSRRPTESRTAPFATVAVIAVIREWLFIWNEIVFNELHNIQQRNGCWNSLSYTFVQIGLFATTLHLVVQISVKYISSSIAKIEITIW